MMNYIEFPVSAEGAAELDRKTQPFFLTRIMRTIPVLSNNNSDFQNKLNEINNKGSVNYLMQVVQIYTFYTQSIV